LEAAAVGTSRDGEGDNIVTFVGSVGVLGNDVVDWKAGGFGVCSTARAREDVVGGGWGSGYDEGVADKRGSQSEELHFRIVEDCDVLLLWKPVLLDVALV
jgi:hypothetical protein